MTSKLPFHNPLVVNLKYYNVLAIFSLDYEIVLLLNSVGRLFCTYTVSIQYTYTTWPLTRYTLRIVGEPKSRIVQKHTFFAPERYTAGILYTDSLNSA